jgi:hypothetical protein
MTTFNAKHLNAFIMGYFEALYFAETATNSDGEEVDNLAGVEMTDTAREECRQECAQFMDLAPLLLKAATLSGDYDHTQAGRDFWFSRQGHGVGFWDRGLGAIGDALHKVAEQFGEKHIYINENGLIEVE